MKETSFQVFFKESKMEQLKDICEDCDREYFRGKEEAHRNLWHNPKINGRKEWIQQGDYGIRDDD
jgi:hypothetical protein